MNKQKGFTIIELIVVIAIIAVLAAIVLVNVTSYIAKGKDSAIKSNLGTIKTNAAAYYDQQTTPTYVNFVNSIMYTNPATAINQAGAPVYGEYENQTSFCAYANLASTSTSQWCVDSTGYSGNVMTKCNAAANASCN